MIRELIDPEIAKIRPVISMIGNKDMQQAWVRLELYLYRYSSLLRALDEKDELKIDHGLVIAEEDLKIARLK